MILIANSNNKDYTEKYIRDNIIDIQDLELLNTQGQAQLVLALGYFLEYIATTQAMDVILLRLNKRINDYYSGIYNEQEEERLEEEEFVWKNAGLDADKTALMAAELELLGQTIITYIDGIKFSRFATNVRERDLLLARTANEEILLGAIFEEIAYILNLKGVRILYDISNENPVFD